MEIPAMEIRETSFSFPALRGTGPQRGTQVVVFPRPVIRAVAVGSCGCSPRHHPAPSSAPSPHGDSSGDGTTAAWSERD
jgi:hypothetical protein